MHNNVMYILLITYIRLKKNNVSKCVPLYGIQSSRLTE